MALMLFPNPLDCMNTAELRPVAYPPTATPTASSSRLHQVEERVRVDPAGDPVNRYIRDVRNQRRVPVLQCLHNSLGPVHSAAPSPWTRWKNGSASIRLVDPVNRYIRDVRNQRRVPVLQCLHNRSRPSSFLANGTDQVVVALLPVGQLLLVLVRTAPLDPPGLQPLEWLDFAPATSAPFLRTPQESTVNLSSVPIPCQNNPAISNGALEMAFFPDSLPGRSHPSSRYSRTGGNPDPRLRWAAPPLTNGTLPKE